MALRDVAVTAIAGTLTVIALGRPDIGVLAWTWLSTMNPHRMGWGFAYDMPFAAMIAAATLVGMLFYKGPRRFPLYAPVIALLLFDLWMIVTHFAGFYPDLSEQFAVRIIKIQFMLFITLYLLVERWQLNAFIAVLAGSIAFFGVKGGVFTLLSGGSARVWGPTDSFLQGNNEIGIALVMTIPLLFYLRSIVANVWIQRVILISGVFCAASALGTQSRGALLAISAMSMLLWWRSQKKAVVGVALVVVAVGLLAFMPQTWEDRMRTLQNYEQDLSSMQRIDVWRMTWNLALDNPLTGGGYAIYTNELNAIYNPNPIGGLRNAHSIYFSVLGEHGFVGLALFLAVWLYTWGACNWVRSRSKGRADLSWAYLLASMLQVSLVGYLVGGAFLYLAYADFPYGLMVSAVVLKDILRRSLLSQEEKRTSLPAAAVRPPSSRAA